MKRDILAALRQWKEDSGRRPLLLRGARQTGKTFVLNQFGDSDFQSRVTINFERNPELKEVFSSNAPREIIEKIALYTGKAVRPGQTLLFLDEIQECPPAIMALRYFHEEMPELHVVGAGSLLEFALNDANFRMPVGRVQFLYLRPLSFGEFLDALGHQALRRHVADPAKLPSLPETLHEKLLELLRKYLMLGGMPAVVRRYAEEGDLLKCQRMQHALIESFLGDFGKYARESRHKYLRKVFNATPAQVGGKFVYAQVDREIKSRDLKEAVGLLEQAGIVSKVRLTSGAGLPLEAGASDDYYKLIFLDVGLLHALSGIHSETARESDFTAIYKGAVAEQFVGQEILAHAWPTQRQHLFYWARTEKGSSAEVDYLVEKDGRVVPVEVKSGPRGKLKSLSMFLQKHQSPLALKVSQAPFEEHPPLTSLPLYALESQLAWPWGTGL